MFKTLITAGLISLASFGAYGQLKPEVGMVGTGSEQIVCDTEDQAVEIAIAWAEGFDKAVAAYGRLNGTPSATVEGEESCIIIAYKTSVVKTIHPITGDFTYDGHPMYLYSVELATPKGNTFWSLWVDDPTRPRITPDDTI